MAAIKKPFGVSGNMGFNGIDTGEYLKKLMGDAGKATYNEMRRSDHQVAVALRAIMLPIRQAKFYIEPASDSAQDKEIAETIEKNLFNGMSITWDDVIRHILLMLPFGFMIMEKVWELRDGKYYLAKLDPRLPTSICDSSTWTFDPVTKSLKVVKQMDALGTILDLPIDYLLIFTNDKEGDNWEGIPLLRTTYKSYDIKNSAEKINIIGLDRYGVGIIICEMPEGCSPDSTEWKKTGEALEAVCANENAYLQVPFGSKVYILSAEGKGVDALPTIKHYEEAITKAVLAQFVDLGTTGAGNRALGESFLNMFLLSLQAYANYICDVMNRFLIQEYVNYNWKVQEYPKLKVQQIQKLDAQTLATLANAKLLTPDEELENAVRKQEMLPEKKTEPVVDPAKAPGEEGEEDQAPAGKDGQVQEQPDLQKQKEGAGMPDEVKASDDIAPAQAAPAGRRTKPEDFAFCDFRAMELRLDDAAATYSRRILQLKEAQRADIVAQLVAGKSVSEVRLDRKKREMLDLLLEAYDAQHRAGMEDVRGEFKRQGIKLAAPKTKKSKLKTPRDQYEAYAWLEVEGASSKLTSTIAREELNRIGEELDEVELKKALDEVPVSDRTWTSMMNGAINEGWGNGREEAADEYRDEIDYCIYTSVLDQNTCPSCEMKDGAEHQFGEAEYETPSPTCSSPDDCRCMTVYVMKAESLPEAEYEKWRG